MEQFSYPSSSMGLQYKFGFLGSWVTPVGAGVVFVLMVGFLVVGGAVSAGTVVGSGGAVVS